MTFSIYIKNDYNMSSTIKFGGMNNKGIREGGSMALYRTKARDTWALKGGNFNVNNYKSTMDGEREMHLKFNLPFLYLPK
mgnify:CR=1 FL=1